MRPSRVPVGYPRAVPPLVRRVLLVFLLAFATRAAVLLLAGPGAEPEGDERGYALLATSLAAGDGLQLALPDELHAPDGRVPAPRTSFRAPLVPLLFAPFARGGLPLLRWVSVLVGALGAPLLLAAAARGPLGPRAALVAACAYALWPPAVHVSVRALSEPFAVALLLGGVIALGAARGHTAAPAGGALAGLAVLARPAVLPAAVLLCLAARGRRGAALALLACALVVAPWAARNARLHGRPLLTTNSGVTLVGGNSAAAADATVPGKWLPPEVVYAHADDPPDLGMWGWSALGEAESDARFSADARAWAAEHPAQALRLAAAKLVRLVDPDPHSARGDAGRKALVGWLTLPPVLLLALLGAWRARGAVRPWTPWLALLAGTVVTVVVFYGDTRMRAPADPALLALAAAGLAGPTRPGRDTPAT